MPLLAQTATCWDFSCEPPCLTAVAFHVLTWPSYLHQAWVVLKSLSLPQMTESSRSGGLVRPLSLRSLNPVLNLNVLLGLGGWCKGQSGSAHPATPEAVGTHIQISLCPLVRGAARYIPRPQSLTLPWDMRWHMGKTKPENKYLLND